MALEFLREEIAVAVSLESWVSLLLWPRLASLVVIDPSTDRIRRGLALRVQGDRGWKAQEEGRDDEEALEEDIAAGNC